MKLIDSNSFPKGSVNRAGIEYKMHVNIICFNDEAVNDYAKPIEDTIF
jgi:hypothetical protein